MGWGGWGAAASVPGLGEGRPRMASTGSRGVSGWERGA